MTTIHPLDLAEAMAHHENSELLDVRSRRDFERAHIRGARSVPLRTLQAAGLLRARGRRNPAPIFLISDQCARASMAAGILQAGGCVHPVVIEGGMRLWETQGLPVVRPRRRHEITAPQWLGNIICPLARMGEYWRDAVRRRVRARSRRHLDNAWWCRLEFQAREAYRG